MFCNEEAVLVMGEWTADLEQWMQEQTVQAGFDAAGIAPVSAPESDESQLDAERFSAWVAAGRAGEMEYLKRRDEQGVLLRSAVQVAMPWARSVIVCALNYNAAGPRSIEAAPSDAGWVARYAWSGRDADATSAGLIPTDYHDELLHRLRQVERALKQRLPCETRCYVDTGPLVERTAPANAALNEAADRCGSCTRCIDACPTDALVAPREMDASRCIAYLTIEKKGSIPEELRGLMGRQVFGCDICQDVCPWNRKAPVSAASPLPARQALINPALEWLAAMDGPAFNR